MDSSCLGYSAGMDDLRGRRASLYPGRPLTVNPAGRNESRPEAQDVGPVARRVPEAVRRPAARARAVPAAAAEHSLAALGRPSVLPSSFTASLPPAGSKSYLAPRAPLPSLEK